MPQGPGPVPGIRKAYTFDATPPERRSTDNPRTGSVPLSRDTVKFPSPRDSSSSTTATPSRSDTPSPATASKAGGDQQLLRRIDSRPRSKSLLSASTSHKRSSSGNIFSRVPFFRTNTTDISPPSVRASGAPDVNSNTPPIASEALISPSASDATTATSPSTSVNSAAAGSGTIPFPTARTSPPPLETDGPKSQPTARTLALINSVTDWQTKNQTQAQLIAARRRKGSLRKTALLTPSGASLPNVNSKTRPVHRNRSTSSAADDGITLTGSKKTQPATVQRRPTPPGSPKREQPALTPRQPSAAVNGPTSPTKRSFAFELPDAASSTETVPESVNIDSHAVIDISQSGTADTPATSIDNQTSAASPDHLPISLSPIASPATGPYPSTTSTTSDEDHHMRSPLPPALKTNDLQSTTVPPPLTSRASTSPSPPSSESSRLPLLEQRRRSTKPASPLSHPASHSQSVPLPSLFHPSSHPLSALRQTPTVLSTSPFPTKATAADLSDPTDWDYSATERWGWLILIVTWIVVVVGMGSCLGVWSWAWDVSIKPYAPPELEDDPTLPIVGYYPALLVLTGVMSWVWVVVAWIGMKYFKHAKIQAEA